MVKCVHLRTLATRLTLICDDSQISKINYKLKNGQVGQLKRERQSPKIIDLFYAKTIHQRCIRNMFLPL